MPSFPTSHRGDVVESLHGQRIADPYRWLEDPDSAETADWVTRQNAYSRDHLAGLAERPWFAATMDAIVHRPRAGVPLPKAGRWFLTRNDGHQAQDVLYVADTLDELRAGGGRVLIDPNTFSADGTDSLAGFRVSGDGRRLAYGVSVGGSDWLDYRLLDLATGEDVPDAPIQSKFDLPTWLPDHASYLYLGYPRETRADGTQTAASGSPQLRRHRFGADQADDEVLLEFPEDDQLIFWPELSHDDRWLVVPIVRGTETRNRLWVFPVSGTTIGVPIPVVAEPVADVTFLRVDGEELLLHTDLDAPRGRVVRCPIAAGDPLPPISEVIAEGESTLAAAVTVGEVIITESLVDVRPRLDRWSLSGDHLGRLAIDGGAVTAITGEPGAPYAGVGMSSVTRPTRAHLVDTRTGTVEALDDLIPAGKAWAPPEVKSQRLTAVSADGTPVTCTVIIRADLDLDRPRPTLIWGYGGFRIPLLADFRPGWPAWVAAGGVLVIAHLRGGGEFGQAWYDDGRGPHKQHVFDDAIAVAEHLIAAGITTSDQLALHGRSNGGLLVGAVLTQRPELLAAAIPAVGVLDLLRFHLFTYGRAWISDYGDPDDPDDFATALDYSPLHRVRVGTAYPPTLVLTGDHDDRVVPLHSHKFTATLQHAQAGESPILTRIEVATGHGAGKPTALVAAEWADLLAFAAHHTGLTPPTG